MKTLKDFGFGKQGMEQIILEEVALFKIFIAKYVGAPGAPVDISSKMNLPILNSLWRVTVGERFDYDDQRLLDICHRLTEGFKVFVSTKQNFVYSFPWIMKIPFASKLFDFQLVTRVVNDIVDLMQENIRKHQETLDVNEPRDFTDMVLKEIERTTDPSSSFYGQDGLDNLKVTLSYVGHLTMTIDT